MCQSKLNLEKSVLIVLTSCSPRPRHTAESDRPSLEPFEAPTVRDGLFVYFSLKTFCCFIDVGGFNVNKAAEAKEVSAASVFLDSDYLKHV